MVVDSQGETAYIAMRSGRFYTLDTISGGIAVANPLPSGNLNLAIEDTHGLLAATTNGNVNVLSLT